MARNSELSAKATQTLGLPEGIKFYSVAPFAGMNVKDAPTSVQDSEFVYLENFIKIGDGSLRTIWDAGSALYTAPGGLTIVYYSFFTISTNYYVFIVLSDGSAVQVNTVTGVQTSIGTGFYNAATGKLPCARQWGSTYLMISNNNTTNDYWAWDGSILYGAGTAAPNGVNLTGVGYAYGSAPTVTAYGGQGSGMTFTARVQGGSVSSVSITNPGSGYAPGDIVQMQFSGGLSDTAAELQAVLTATGVGGVNVIASGSGYAAPPTVQFSGGGGSGAAGVATVSGGVVTAVTVTSPGSGYTSAPSVAFLGGGGSGAGATATITGVVSSLSLSNTNSVVSDLYGISVSITGGGGSGATASLVLTAYGQHAFTVTGIRITNPGSGYTSAPTVTLNVYWLIGSATASATITNAVNSVAVSPGGSGYAQNPTVSISGGSGSGALGTAIVSNSVVSIGVTAGGSGYTTPPAVLLSGGSGTGATALANVVNGMVTSISVTNGGQDYATPPSVSFVGGGGAGASAIATISGRVVGVNVTNAGSGFTSLPTVTISGGGGSGALAVAALKPTNVASISIVNGGSGYSSSPYPTLTVTGGGGSGCTATVNGVSGGAISSISVGGSGGKNYTNPPAVEIAPGANNAAYGTVSLMPFGVSGSSLEMFGSHVWVFNPAAGYGATIPPGTQYVWSAPNVVWDFATSDGGGAGQSTDSFLQTQYVNARQSSGYLYIFGDGSISSVLNLTATTSGSTVTTTFTYQNVDPQVGLSWRDSLQEYGRTIVLANSTGIFGLYGGSASKVSEKIDQLLNYQGESEANVMKAVYPVQGGVTPSSATAHIFNVKYYLNLLTIYDPSISGNRNVMVAWNEKDWFVLSQSVALTSISTQKFGSFYYAWGSDGNSIYPLFNTPSSSLTKKLTTKYFGADQVYIQKQALAVWLLAQDASSGQAGVSGSMALQSSGVAPLAVEPPAAAPFAAGVYADLLQQPAFVAPTPAFGLWGTSAEGLSFTNMGVNFTTTSPDFILANLILGYKDVTAYYG